jgi:hypothetical protein
MRLRRAHARLALDQGAPQWVRLAQEEIGLRIEADATEHRASLERELQMQVRLRARYPEIPAALATEFSRLLAARHFTWEAWDDAVAWLETTKWFKQSATP